MHHHAHTSATLHAPVLQLMMPTLENVRVVLIVPLVGRKLQSNQAVGRPGTVVMTTSRVMT